jgi:4-diphosphocytidyl-2-C-methyl-D-erythritol kinase
LLVFPNCKINLGLNIVGKRPDGYHDIETVFYPIPFCDALEIIEDTDPAIASPGQPANIRFTSTGLPIPGTDADNLCVKAYQLLKKEFPRLSPVQMHLHKCIPMGAGLGGGSSNGAFALQLINQKFELGIAAGQLQHYALLLGSDCPFFIVNKPCYALGRGEALEQVSLDLKGYTLVLIYPNIHISTADAFALLRPKVPLVNVKDIIAQPVETWKERLVNDFEAAVFQLRPELVAIKATLYGAGATYVSMTGSGSSIYGLFKEPPTTLKIENAGGLVKHVTL